MSDQKQKLITKKYSTSANSNVAVISNDDIPLAKVQVACNAPDGMVFEHATDPLSSKADDAYATFLTLMNRYLNNYHLIVAEFEKVSYDVFYKEYRKVFIKSIAAHAVETGEKVAIYSEEEIHTIAKSVYDKIKLPERSTVGSAGYDFFFPYQDTVLPNGVQFIVPTGIKCKINYPGYALFLFPRSSYGFAHQMKIDNTIPVIDADYYGNSKNEGHIMVAITNQSNDKHSFTIANQDKFCQGIFLPIGYAKENEVTGIRTGGIGSTGK